MDPVTVATVGITAKLTAPLLKFGVEKVWDLLVRETERLKGVGEQFSKLKSDINLLRSFVKDADAKKHANNLVRNCVEEIKEIVLDAEDVIETFLLKEELGRTGGMRNRIRRRAFYIVDRRNFALDMGGISGRISTVISNMQSFGVQQIIVDDNTYSVPLQERQREIRRTFPSNNESNLVGLQENVKKLVGYLVEEYCIQVVSISGMGGIGKTTLVRQVFNHDLVKNHFDGLAWVCVSQQFTQKYVWQTILLQLSLKHDEHKNSNMSHMTEDELQGKLFRLLETGKYLIVLDDMWKKEDWDRVKPMFPPTKGWKLILTSRNDRVGLHADPTCVTFKPECLTPEDSWSLFRKIAFPSYDTSEFNVNEEMEEMGKKMIKHCGGLPLAVKVLGGMLASKNKLHEWKRIYENIRSHLVGGIFSDGNHNSVQYLLSLSFEELPVSLKYCFLYLAHFPEDYPIDMEKLSYYWAAEGILELENYERASIQVVADMYMEELVNRNMVMFEGYNEGTSRFKTCRLHDMMKEVCLLKVKEEKFLDIVHGTCSKSPNRSRRLVIYLPYQIYQMEKTMENPKLRSFMFIMGQLGTFSINSSFNFTQLQLMRILDISWAKFEGGKMSSSIGNLIHLRYLSLYMAYVTHLPFSMRNLKKLLYLNLNMREGNDVPNILKEMQELRYLSLPSDGMHDKTKLELGNLINLETLENFSTKHSSVEDLQGMTRLMTLSINFRGEGCTKEDLSSSLSKLSHLEVLNIDHNSFSSSAPINDEEGFVLDCVNVKQLYLNIYMPRLPEEGHFPSHLSTISLLKCGLKEDPMPILEKLLHLKKVILEFKTFCGRRMVCSNGGFPKLQDLSLIELEEWEKWVIEEGSMPLLRTLFIMKCPKLKELPDGLQFITSLKELTMEKEWTDRLSEGGNNYYKVQHISSVKFLSRSMFFPNL